MSYLCIGAIALRKTVLLVWQIGLLMVVFVSAVQGSSLESLPPLSLEAALREAESRSQALVAEDAAAFSAREMAVNAKQLPDPTLGLAINNLPVEGTSAYRFNDDDMTMTSISISQTFTRVDKRRAREEMFVREAESAEASYALALRNLRRNTALAWFDRYFQQQMVELLSSQRAEARLQVDAAKAAYRAGRGLEADIFLAETSVASIEDRILAAQAQLDNAVVTLSRWVGDLAVSPLGSRPALSQSRYGEQDLEHGINQHPDIVWMATQESQALAAAEVARQEKRSDWNLSLMYSQRGDDFANMVSVEVSAPLQWHQRNRQDRVIAAELAKADQARAERRERVREHLAETRRWFIAWRSYLGRLDHFDTRLIPLAQERTRAALAAYRGGQGSLATVIDARRAQIDTQLARLQVEMETAQLWVALEFLTLPDNAPGAQTAAMASVPSETLEQ
ncbi:MAG: TolC family protein [Porticoccaceae bacterium]|nr:TolC family protein [Porticoccaceae bacterium]